MRTEANHFDTYTYSYSTSIGADPTREAECLLEIVRHCQCADEAPIEAGAITAIVNARLALHRWARLAVLTPDRRLRPDEADASVDAYVTAAGARFRDDTAVVRSALRQLMGTMIEKTSLPLPVVVTDADDLGE